jgi:hypothetical protein
MTILKVRKTRKHTYRVAAIRNQNNIKGVALGHLTRKIFTPRPGVMLVPEDLRAIRAFALTRA